jgi:Transglutaminase-like superfamily
MREDSPATIQPQHLRREVWRLSSHVWAAAVGDYIVLLNGRDRQFYMLNGPSAAAFGRVLGLTTFGGSARPVSTGYVELKEEERDFIDELAHFGLVRCTSIGLPAQESSEVGSMSDETQPRLLSDTATALQGCKTKVTAKTRFIAAVSLLLTKFLLRAVTLDGLYRLLKLARRSVHRDATAEAASRLLRAVAVTPIRAVVSTACLEESLAVYIGLLLSGMRAHWVLGVRVPPFEAHSWIECDAVPIGQPLGLVSLMTPLVEL